MEQVLGDFRQWLTELASPNDDTPEEVPPPIPDLSTLLGEMIALKQEVHLQTKATRQQQEQNQETLLQLETTVEALQQQSTTHENDTVRKAVRSLTELYDVLALAQREVARVQEEILPHLGEMPNPEESESLQIDFPELPVEKVSFWGRLAGTGSSAEKMKQWQQQVQESCSLAVEKARAQERKKQQEWGVRIGQLLTSMVTGYTMSLQRVERALQQRGLEVIATVGEAFDPETMEVLEVVTDTDRADNEVVDEVRRGYRWDGKLFRTAQVRVAKK